MYNYSHAKFKVDRSWLLTCKKKEKYFRFVIVQKLEIKGKYLKYVSISWSHMESLLKNVLAEGKSVQTPE